MANFIVSIGNDSLQVTAAQLTGVDYVQCGVFPGIPKTGETVRVTCIPGPLTGRFLYVWIDRVDVMDFCEIIVFAGKLRRGKCS